MSICSNSHGKHYLQTGYPFNQQKKKQLVTFALANNLNQPWGGNLVKIMAK